MGNHHIPDLILRLNRIEDQIRGVKGLIEKEAYCDDILNQIVEIQAALNRVRKLLLEQHLNKCVISRIRKGDYEIIDEFLGTIQKLMN